MNARKRLFTFLFAALAVLLFTACGKWDYSREAVKAANEAQGDTLRVEFKVNQTFTSALRAAVEDNIQPNDVDKAMTMDKSIEKLLTSGYRLDVYALRADTDADQAAAQLADEFVNRLSGCEDEGFISMVKAENGYFYEAVLVYKHDSGSGSGGGNESSDPEVKPEPDPEPEPVEYAVIWDNSTKTLTCRATKTSQAWMEMGTSILSEKAVEKALLKQGEDALDGFSLKNVEKLVIDNQSGIFTIAENAFGSFNPSSQVTNTTLKEVYLYSITQIKKDAFANCVNLNTVVAPEVTKLGLRAFYNCETLESVDMSQLRSIENTAAFAECSSLTTVNMPFLTDIPNETFRDCTSLTTVTLPYAESIGSMAFMSCGLKTINLPSAQEVGIVAFSFCSSLQTIELPKAHTLGAQAFSNCGALNTVKLGTKLQSVGENLFMKTPNSFTICYGGDNFENDINDAELTNEQGTSPGEVPDRMEFIGLSDKTITYQKY